MANNSIKQDESKQENSKLNKAELSKAEQVTIIPEGEPNLWMESDKKDEKEEEQKKKQNDATDNRTYDDKECTKERDHTKPNHRIHEHAIHNEQKRKKHGKSGDSTTNSQSQSQKSALSDSPIIESPIVESPDGEISQTIDCGKFTIVITNKATPIIDETRMTPIMSPLYSRIKNRKGKVPSPRKLEFSEDESSL